MTRVLRYTPAHEEVLKCVTGGLTLDEVLVLSEDEREDIRVKLYDLFMNVSEEVNSLSADLDTMVRCFGPGLRCVTEKDDGSWIEGWREYAKEHPEVQAVIDEYDKNPPNTNEDEIVEENEYDVDMIRRQLKALTESTPEVKKMDVDKLVADVNKMLSNFDEEAARAEFEKEDPMDYGYEYDDWED